jgi:hypothetical protein
MTEAAANAGRDAPGAAPRLKRVLTRGDLILFGLVILTPTVTYRHLLSLPERPP